MCAKSWKLRVLIQASTSAAEVALVGVVGVLVSAKVFWDGKIVLPIKEMGTTKRQSPIPIFLYKLIWFDYSITDMVKQSVSLWQTKQLML
jgi:hypothetical protein